jgi:hypothetical protein
LKSGRDEGILVKDTGACPGCFGKEKKHIRGRRTEGKEKIGYEEI